MKTKKNSDMKMKNTHRLWTKIGEKIIEVASFNAPGVIIMGGGYYRPAPRSKE